MHRLTSGTVVRGWGLASRCCEPVCTSREGELLQRVFVHLDRVAPFGVGGDAESVSLCRFTRKREMAHLYRP